MSRWTSTRWESKECGSASSSGGGGAPTGFAVDLVKITPSPLEVGASLANPNFNLLEVNATGPLVPRDLDDDQGNPTQDMTGLGNPVTMPFTYTKTVINDTVDFTYSANDGTGLRTDVEQYIWQPRVYLGVAPIPGGGVNEAFVEALAENELRGNKGISRLGIVWTAGEYIWIAFPQTFNPTQLTDFLIQLGGSGFPGGFVLDTAGVSVTPNTAFGVPILYDVWRSTGSGIGLTVDVSVAP